MYIITIILGALLGHNLTDVVDMTNKFDNYVKNSTLDELIRYVRLNFFLWGYFSSFLLYRSLLAEINL